MKAKNETIKYLTDLMGVIDAAYFKGRMEGHPLWVHERSDDSTAISIDLYNFEGDGLPVCDGLKPCTITFDDNTTDTGWLFCMCYDPDDVTPLIFLFTPDGYEEGDMAINPEDVPEEVLKNIIAWLEKILTPNSYLLTPKPSLLTPKPSLLTQPSNGVTSFFFYMWNAWCKEECQKAFSAPGSDWQHFWSKWCGICKTYGTHGAAERFYAELSNKNRNLLVKRATEVYEGDCEKQS